MGQTVQQLHHCYWLLLLDSCFVPQPLIKLLVQFILTTVLVKKLMYSGCHQARSKASMNISYHHHRHHQSHSIVWNWGTEKLRNLPSVIQLGKRGTRIWIPISLPPKASSFHSIFWLIIWRPDIVEQKEKLPAREGFTRSPKFLSAVNSLSH